MSALAIDSQYEIMTPPARVAPVRPRTRPVDRRPASLPRFSSVVPLRPADARSCQVVAAPLPAANAAAEWEWTPRALRLGVALMLLTAVLGLTAVVAAFLAIPN